MITPVFAVARTVGWLAHWNEMIVDPETRIFVPANLTRARQRPLVRPAQRPAHPPSSADQKASPVNKRVDVAELAAVVRTLYPSPFDAPCRARERRKLGDAAGLSQFGVKLLRCRRAPGRASVIGTPARTSLFMSCPARSCSSPTAEKRCCAPATRPGARPETRRGLPAEPLERRRPGSRNRHPCSRRNGLLLRHRHGRAGRGQSHRLHPPGRTPYPETQGARTLNRFAERGLW